MGSRRIKTSNRNLPALHLADLDSIIDEIINRNIDPTVFDDIDERDIPKAKNCVDFFLSRKFLNQTPFPKQLQICLEFFEEFCISGDSIVCTDKGVFEIENLCNSTKRGMLPLSKGDRFNISSTLGNSEVTRSGYLGKKETRKLVLEKGHDSIGTNDQKYLVLKPDLSIVWENIQNIRKGDYVVLKTGDNVWTKKEVSFDFNFGGTDISEYQNSGRPYIEHKVPNRLTKDLARFLGYLISDGNIYKSTVSFEVESGHYYNDIIRCLKSCFPTCDLDKTEHYTAECNLSADQKVYSDLSKVQFSGKKIVNFLSYIGANEGLSYEKVIPWCILQAPKKYVIEFLRGIYWGDRCIGGRLDLTNEKLLRQIQALLNNFGIKTSISWRNSKKYVSKKDGKTKTTNEGMLYCVAEGNTLFHKLIGYQPKTKKDRFTKNLLKYGKTHINYTESIPYMSDIFCEFENSKPSYHYRLNKPVRLHVDAQFKNIDNKKQSFYRYMKKQNPDLYNKVMAIIDIMRKGSFFRKVLSNTKHKKIKVYDLTVPSCENFVINGGVVVHNCPHCSDPKIIHNMFDQDINEILDRVQLLEYGRCKKCKRTKYDLYKEGHVTYKHSLRGCAGQRAGKSKIVSWFCIPYITHRYLTLGHDNYRISPQRYFGLPPTDILKGTCTALTVGKAMDLIWNPLMQTIKEAPWFKTYHEFLQRVGEEKGIEILHQGATFMFYQHKRLAMGPETPDYGKLRGATRWWTSVDEIDYFDCLMGDSLINTDKGLIPIKNNLTGINSFSNNKNSRIINHKFSGYKKIKKVVLKKGYSLKGSSKHKVLVLTKDLTKVWKKTGNLRKGDYVAVTLGGEFPDLLSLSTEFKTWKRKYDEAYSFMLNKEDFTTKYLRSCGIKHPNAVIQPLVKKGMLEKKFISSASKNAGRLYSITSKFDIDTILEDKKNNSFSKRERITFPKTMGVELASLLGFLVSEGSYNKSQSISFSNKDKKIVKKYVKYFKKVFGIKPNIHTYKRKGLSKEYIVEFSYVHLKKYFRYLGLKETTSDKKSIPWSILQADKKSVLAFISAFIEGDGSIYSNSISLPSKSKRLLQDFQILLLKLGCISSLLKRGFKYIEGKRFFIYKLTLNQYDSLKLVDMLESCLKSKNFIKAITGRCDAYKLPYVNPTFSYACYEKINRHTKEDYIYLDDILNDHYNSVYLRTLKESDKITYKKVKGLIKDKTIWLPVEKIVDLGVKKTYDVRIDSKSHAFTANGIVVHNSEEDSKKVTLSAEEISIALENSLETVRNKANKLIKSRPYSINSYSFDISSPSSITGKIMRELEKSKVDKHIYGFHLATWEMNPNYTYEDLKDKFETNPVRAWRDWGAVPPLAENPFFENVSALKNSIREEKQNLLTYRIKTRSDKFGETTVYAEVTPNYKDDIPRCLTVDMGASNNAFALTLGHLEEDKPYLDFILIVEPLELTDDRKIKINTRAMFEHAIVPILENYKVTHVVYDRWSSLDAIREIRDKYEIEADQYTLTPTDFETTIWPAINTPEEISYPKPEVNLEELDTSKYNKNFSGFETVMKKVKSCFVSTLLLQMLTVRQAGRKVVKPMNGDDDGFRSFCLLLVYLLNGDINWKFKGSGAKSKVKRGSRMGVVMSLGGGGGSGGGGGGGSKIGRLASRGGGGSAGSTGGTGGKIGRLVGS